jgi:hypothetical protein
VNAGPAGNDAATIYVAGPTPALPSPTLLSAPVLAAIVKDGPEHSATSYSPGPGWPKLSACLSPETRFRQAIVNAGPAGKAALTSYSPGPGGRYLFGGSAERPEVAMLNAGPAGGACTHRTLCRDSEAIEFPGDVASTRRVTGACNALKLHGHYRYNQWKLLAFKEAPFRVQFESRTGSTSSLDLFQCQSNKQVINGNREMASTQQATRSVEL